MGLDWSLLSLCPLAQGQPQPSALLSPGQHVQCSWLMPPTPFTKMQGQRLRVLNRGGPPGPPPPVYFPHHLQPLPESPACFQNRHTQAGPQP